MVIQNSRELAYLYDLYITPLWREPFDQLFNEKVGLPVEGDILEVNCGTGGHSLEIATKMGSKGNVIGIDSSKERIELATAKTSIAKLENIQFDVGDSLALPYADNSFDLVIGDASLLTTEQFLPHVKELYRVARPDATVAVYLTTRGSFDEFFSLYWEALYQCSLSDQLLHQLENLINERFNYDDAAKMVETTGLQLHHSLQKKEEFSFETAETFFTSPLIANYMLEDWLAILPTERVDEVQTALTTLINEERGDYPFEVSIKAAVFVGQKSNKKRRH